jgi:hypothetical protein
MQRIIFINNIFSANKNNELAKKNIENEDFLMLLLVLENISMK